MIFRAASSASRSQVELDCLDFEALIGRTFLAAMDVVAEVVSYDPVRRRGFLKALEPGIGTFLFGFAQLPDEVKLALEEPSRRVRHARKHRSVPGVDDFQAASSAAKAIIRHQRFTVDVSQRGDGQWVITRSTMQWIPEPAWRLGEQVRIRELKSPPEVYDGWNLNQRPPQVGEIGILLDFLHAPGIPDHYVVECSQLLVGDRPLWLSEFRADELESID